MAGIDPLSDWWVHQFTLEPFLGAGPEGDQYGPPEQLTGFVDEKVRVVRAPSGEEVTSSTTIYLPRSTANVPPKSRVTIGQPFTARRSSVIGCTRHDGGGRPTPDHVEVTLA